MERPLPMITTAPSQVHADGTSPKGEVAQRRRPDELHVVERRDDRRRGHREGVGHEVVTEGAEQAQRGEAEPLRRSARRRPLERHQEREQDGADQYHGDIAGSVAFRELVQRRSSPSLPRECNSAQEVSIMAYTFDPS
jgi:hypothetical protein